MMLNIDNKINLIWKAFKLVVDPLTPPIIAKYNIRSLAHYFNSADSHEILNLQPTNIVTWVRLNDNITIYPQLVGHIFLSLSPAATETHVFQPYKMTHYYRLVSCVMINAKKFSTKTHLKSWVLTENESWKMNATLKMVYGISHWHHLVNLHSQITTLSKWTISKNNWPNFSMPHVSALQLLHLSNQSKCSTLTPDRAWNMNSYPII